MTLPPILLLSLLLLLLLTSTITTTASTTTTTTTNLQSLLNSQGLPAGLFPNNIKSYDLDPTTGLLQVYFDQPCLARYETTVYFDKVVKANLTYGRLLGLEGLAQQELFLWLPVKDIIVNDPSSGLIVFDIGLAHKQLSLSIFEDPPECSPKGVFQS